MPERDLPIPDPVLRLLWRGVELSVFVLLIVKDRRIPSWSGASPHAGARRGPAVAPLERRRDFVESR